MNRKISPQQGVGRRFLRLLKKDDYCFCRSARKARICTLAPIYSKESVPVLPDERASLTLLCHIQLANKNNTWTYLNYEGKHILTPSGSRWQESWQRCCFDYQLLHWMPLPGIEPLPVAVEQEPVTRAQWQCARCEWGATLYNGELLALCSHYCLDSRRADRFINQFSFPKKRKAVAFLQPPQLN